MVREEVHLAREATGRLEDRFLRRRLEERQLGPGTPQQVREVAGQLVARETSEMVTHDDALRERFVRRHADTTSQLGMSDEEEAEAVVGVHRVVGKQTQIFEHLAPQVVRLVDDQDRTALCLLTEARYLGTDLPVETGAVSFGGEPERLGYSPGTRREQRRSRASTWASPTSPRPGRRLPTRS